MRNIGPFGLENRIFAGLCGVGVLLLSLIIFGWGFFGSLIFAAIIAIIVLFYLMMQGGNGVETTSSGSQGQGTATPASSAPPAPAPEKVATAVDPQIKTDKAMQDDTGTSGAVAVDPQIKSDAPDVADTLSTDADVTPNADVTEPVEEWKSEGGGFAADKAPVVDETLDTPAKVADASAEMHKSTGDADDANLPEREAEWKSEGGGTASEKAPVVDETLDTPAKVAEASAEMHGSKVNPTASLPGQDDLASRKGEWKLEGGGSAAVKAPDVDVTLDTPEKVADASAALAAEAGDQDYDGDGIVEGIREGSKPETLTAAREGGADDLKQIKGVGPKMESMLHDMGFFHFDQIAAWSDDEVAWVDANLKGFKGRVSRDNWVDQATILASGGETPFSTKVGKGGVY